MLGTPKRPARSKSTSSDATKRFTRRLYALKCDGPIGCFCSFGLSLRDWKESTRPTSAGVQPNEHPQECTTHARLSNRNGPKHSGTMAEARRGRSRGGRQPADSPQVAGAVSGSRRSRPARSLLAPQAQPEGHRQGQGAGDRRAAPPALTQARIAANCRRAKGRRRAVRAEHRRLLSIAWRTGASHPHRQRLGVSR